MITNRIAECLLPSERRLLDIDALHYLVVHRVSLAEAKPSIADTELDGPKLVVWQRTEPAIGRGAYHLLIKHDGVIEQCLPLTQRGAHSLSYNRRSIAVALVGDFREHTPEAVQLEALIKVGETLLPLCRDMVGHDDLPGGSSDPTKICPGRIAISLVDHAVAGRLPAGWDEWQRARCVEWAKDSGLIV